MKKLFFVFCMVAMNTFQTLSVKGMTPPTDPIEAAAGYHYQLSKIAISATYTGYIQDGIEELKFKPTNACIKNKTLIVTLDYIKGIENLTEMTLSKDLEVKDRNTGEIVAIIRTKTPIKIAGKQLIIPLSNHSRA